MAPMVLLGQIMGRVGRGPQAVGPGFVVREVEPDAIAHVDDGPDRDGDVFAAPEVALLQQDVGDQVILFGDDQSLNATDFTVAGMHGVAAVHRDFTA